jgi:hypothetical protein
LDFAYGERASDFGLIALLFDAKACRRVSSDGCSFFCSPRSFYIFAFKAAVSEHLRFPRRVGYAGQALVWV